MNSRQVLDLPQTTAAVDQTQGQITFIGTATVLLRCAGFTILTDPNFLHQGGHVHLGYGLRSKRLTNPSMELHELPPLDFVLLSHLHEDHFDRVVAHKLDRTLPILTTPQSAEKLKVKGFTATRGIDTWESLTVTKGQSKVRITAMPGRHGPALPSKLLPAVMGSMLDFDLGARHLRMYITGDTLVYKDLRAIPQRYPEIDIALLHLGGTRIAGILLTMDAAQGVEALKIIAPRVAIPIHYGDYPVFKSPLEDFVAAVKAAGLEETVQYLDRGETYSFALRAVSSEAE